MRKLGICHGLATIRRNHTRVIVRLAPRHPLGLPKYCTCGSGCVAAHTEKRNPRRDPPERGGIVPCRSREVVGKAGATMMRGDHCA